MNTSKSTPKPGPRSKRAVKYPDLERFLENAAKRWTLQSHPSNLHLRITNFDTFYVRFGFKIVLGQVYDPVLDIANVTVKEGKRGQGLFTRLIEYLNRTHPALHLHVENVLNESFQKHLTGLGFKPTQVPLCFFKPSPRSEIPSAG
jgi:N-acetylglutamate synthase-like GNAT family acetyltransferase